MSARRTRAVILGATLVTACTTLVSESTQLALALATSDPVEASALVVARAERDCRGLASALAALDSAAFSSSLTTALALEAVDSGRANCADRLAAITGIGPASAIARSLLADGPRAALKMLEDSDHSASDFRRATILFALEERDAAIIALRRGLAGEEDPTQRTALVRALLADGDVAAAAAVAEQLPETTAARIVFAEALARLAATERLSALIARAPLSEQLELARSAAAQSSEPEKLAIESAPAVLVRAAAEQSAAAGNLEQAALLFQRAAIAAPNDADLFAGLANALSRSGHLEKALVAWDRARAISRATPSYAIDPIAALAAAGKHTRARRRAVRVVGAAQTAAELEVASAAAAAAGAHSLSLSSAKRALAKQPGDGRLAFLVARRHAQSGQPARALDLLVELLRCGAHSRPWHRHEVAAEIAKTAALSGLEARALARLENATCPVTAAQDLAKFEEPLRKQLAVSASQ